MGQTHPSFNRKTQRQHPSSFSDLNELPPEIAVNILSYLNATDLCLASCVWNNLAENEILWRGLCFSKWAYTTSYKTLARDGFANTTTFDKPVFKTLYLILDEAVLIFALNPHQGIEHLIKNHVLDECPLEIAKFINGTCSLFWKSVALYLEERRDVLDELVELQDFRSLSLPDALRRFFKKVCLPKKQGRFLGVLVDKFAERYYACNPATGLSRESVALLCYSLLLLSVDLYSPHVRNKMSKREFIRNNRQVVREASAEFIGDLYDDVYLNGHVAAKCAQIDAKSKKRFRFYRPYGALFELRAPEMSSCCG